MFKKVALLGLIVLASSCASDKQVKVSVNPTATPLRIMQQDFTVPKLKVDRGPDYIPARFIRVYRCSYADDNGNVVKGSFIYVKIRSEKLKASF
jgi:hypothetical protein